MSIVLSPACDRYALHSFPTRRSSDLWAWLRSCHHTSRTRSVATESERRRPTLLSRGRVAIRGVLAWKGTYAGLFLDRKSTRLNSSHQIISYAVFCLKKKRRVLLFDRA